MKHNNAIEVKGISKSFKIYGDRGFTLKDLLLFSNRRKFELRPVIKNISFEVKRGEAIGLIGHNGCGKSTTLKMLTRIMYPDKGTIEMSGRVSSLIELGAGFHPDLTGRENIYINASIFGLTRKEIDARVDDIIAFSELEGYIDNPVRTYSSGMYMRLAFAVAINVDADILLIDEILAVGDAGFQAKCFNRLKEIKAGGVTIVIVSHSLGQIEQICERSLWIHDGYVKAEGKPRDVHPLYLDYMAKERQAIADKEASRRKAQQDKQSELEVKDSDISDSQNNEGNDDNSLKYDEKRWGNRNAKIKKAQLMHGDTEKASDSFTTGESVRIHLEYETKKSIENASIGIGFFRADGVQCYGTNTRIERFDNYTLDGNGYVDIDISGLLLLSGHYTLDLALETGDGIAVDYWREACSFDVYSPIGDVGVARLEHKWNIQ